MTEQFKIVQLFLSGIAFCGAKAGFATIGSVGQGFAIQGLFMISNKTVSLTSTLESDQRNQFMHLKVSENYSIFYIFNLFKERKAKCKILFTVTA